MLHSCLEGDAHPLWHVRCFYVLSPLLLREKVLKGNDQVHFVEFVWRDDASVLPRVAHSKDQHVVPIGEAKNKI